MKTYNLFTRGLLFFSLILFTIPASHGQILKKLKKRAEKAAERTVERRVEQETAKKTDAVLDSILEPGKGGEPAMDSIVNPETNPEKQKGPVAARAPESGSLEVYSKFDFVPGNELMFFDDFSQDFIGDFPSKWDTDGSGEIVRMEDGSVNWFEMKPGSKYFPLLEELPEDYTIEFDLRCLGLDRQTSSTAMLLINLEENNSFTNYRAGRNNAVIKIPLGQYGAFNIRVINKIDGKFLINNEVATDIREAILNDPHIAIAVNGQRLRLWVNETKYVDVPRLVPEGSVINYLRLEPVQLKDGKERLFIRNVKIAEGGLDLRRKLISEGKVSTNGILFESGSAKLQAQSMGIIRQIYQVLQQDGSIKLMILGHTDSDGEAANNLVLSEKRASAVRDVLVEVYGVDTARLQISGKGETDPVAENSTEEGKSKNRRVEFIRVN